MIAALFDRLVDAVSDVLPDFGARLAVDSKALPSWASHPAHDSTPDGRRDWDADYGKKDYRGQRDDGTIGSQETTWFGYKIHLIVDATYELPVAWTVTKASTVDVTEAAPLLQPLQTRHTLILQSAKFFAGGTAAMMIPSWSLSVGTRIPSNPSLTFAICGKIRMPRVPCRDRPL